MFKTITKVLGIKIIIFGLIGLIMGVVLSFQGIMQGMYVAILSSVAIMGGCNAYAQSEYMD